MFTNYTQNGRQRGVNLTIPVSVLLVHIQTRYVIFSEILRDFVNVGLQLHLHDKVSNISFCSLLLSIVFALFTLFIICTRVK